MLSKVGGFDIAGMAGVFLAGAAHHVPVVIDGFISAVAALIAVRLRRSPPAHILASHVSQRAGCRNAAERTGQRSASAL